MLLTPEQAVGQKLLLAFADKDPSPAVLEMVRHYQPAGITLFRHLNVDSPAQVRELARSLQQAAREAQLPSLLIAADQEGGQLMAIGDTTLLPGNMALGAARSPVLARQAGEVLGRELAAMGVNVNYAPCCDVNVNPKNPVIGTRSFGEEPQLVASLAIAMIEGLQSCGIAATAKHFPGHGDTASDSHHGIPAVPHALDRLRQVEFLPFAAAVQAGVRLVMTCHVALPAVEGRSGVPATLSPAVLRGLLRQELGFEGVIVTDAMDMSAIRQGDLLGEDAVRAAAAGVDLLLLTSRPEDHRRVYDSLARAAQSGALNPAELAASAGRVMALKRWLAGQPPQPDLDVIGCAGHREIAAQIAREALTLVQDQQHLLPLCLAAGQRLAVVVPKPLDLTPADTSSCVVPTLAQALRVYLPDTDEFIVPHAPGEQDIAILCQRLGEYGAVVVGTLNAYAQPAQVELVKAVLKTGVPAVVVAMRLPYDLTAFPEAPTFLCTYGILEPSMQALAAALCGWAPTRGHLPVSIPGLYPVGHGLGL